MIELLVDVRLSTINSTGARRVSGGVVVVAPKR